MRRLAVMVLTAVAAVGCGTGSTDVVFDEPVPTLFDESSETQTAEVTTTTEAVVGVDGLDADTIPQPRGGSAGVVRFDGLAAPVIERDGATWTVETPCGGTHTGTSPALTTALVVLDPIGDARTDAGAAELGRNAALAELVRDRLVPVGIGAITTRDEGVDVAASFRRRLADSAGARVVVSIALVDGIAELADDPALEVVHPAADGEARRLAGLVYAAVLPVLERSAVSWPSDVDPGVRAVLNQRGSDYFAVLQEPSGAARVVVHLPLDPEVVDTVWASEGNLAPIGDAIADAIVQHLVTDRVGEGFVTPLEVVRTAEVGDANAGCVDPLSPGDEG